MFILDIKTRMYLGLCYYGIGSRITFALLRKHVRSIILKVHDQVASIVSAICVNNAWGHNFRYM